MSFEHQSYFNKISQNMAIQRLASTFVIWLACSILAVSAQHVGTPGLSPVLGTPGLAPSPNNSNAPFPSMLTGFVGVAISFFFLKEID
nr:hypothetical protein CFP56_51101 [Quercus suber]